MNITFTVPGHPVAKGRPRFVRRGNFVATYTPEKTANYENLVKMAATAAMNGQAPSKAPISLEMDLMLQVPVSWSKKKQHAALNGLVLATKRPDVDNFAKILCDGCNGIVWNDDAQIIALRINKLYSNTPQMVVVIREVAGESA